jgi:hypothetical protein
MAASAWQFYDSFRHHVGIAGIDLSGVNFMMALVQTTTGFADKTLSAYSSLSDEVAQEFGYTTGGQSLSAEAWAATSAGQYAFDSSAAYWSANGGTISTVKGAVIYQSGGELVCYSTLTGTAFDVTDTNSLTITPHATGIFTLT